MTDLAQALRAAPLFAPLADEAVGHYAGLGDELHVPTGGHLAEEGDGQAWFHLLLAGRVEWTRRVGGSDVHVLTHAAGDYFGHEPILLDIPVPVTGTALEDCWAFRFQAAGFWELLSGCPEIRRELLSAVSRRVQTLEGVSAQQAKLAALGTLSAGLAHELNNPAAAVRSGVGPLAAAFADVSAAALRLGGALPDAGPALELLGDLRGGAGAQQLSGLEAADAEDELAGWLDDRGVEDAWGRAGPLARAGLDGARLDALVSALPPAAVGHAVGWLTSALAGTEVLEEIREGAIRISDLVQAMREYTYLDQGERQDVDVHEGLESTLTILTHKLRGGVQVVRDYAADLPTVRARGSELNQVWTNLIDNAIDAMDGAGRLTISTSRDGPRILVDIADTGPGVPLELRDRIFEPYFTTKGVGKGTGLGLDITRRIVDGYGGDLRLESRPGQTHMQVRLPA